MIKKTRTNVYDFNFHLVWVTKYRASIFKDDAKRNTMKQIFQDIAEHYDIDIQEMEVMPDHIHMIISFNPKCAPSSIVKTLKGRSAREWFKQYPETKTQLWKGHLWSPSFLCLHSEICRKTSLKNIFKIKSLNTMQVAQDNDSSRY